MLEIPVAPGSGGETSLHVSPASTDSHSAQSLGSRTMPPWSDDAEPSRAYFRKLRELAARHGVPKLSMGMSHDFEVAIEEGATHIRVGTALFGSRRKA